MVASGDGASIYGLPTFSSAGVYTWQPLSYALAASLQEWQTFTAQEFLPGNMLVYAIYGMSHQETAEIGYDLAQRGVDLIEWPAEIIHLPDWTQREEVESPTNPFEKIEGTWYYRDGENVRQQIEVWPECTYDFVTGPSPIAFECMTVFKGNLYTVPEPL